MMSKFNGLPGPVQSGKHRNCYPSYTNLRDFKSDCTTTTENKKSTRRSSSSKKLCTIIAQHTTYCS